MPSAARKGEKRATFAVQIVPRASKNEVIGIHGDLIKIRLTAPPVEGAANAALVRFIAHKLGVPQSDVQIVAGATSRRKLVAVAGVSPSDVREKLLNSE